MENEKTDIGIVGFGYVGQAVNNLLQPRFNVVSADRRDPDFSERQRQINAFCQLAFICVPTPMLPDGAADTSIVEEVVGWLETPVIVIKSTVPPGTTGRLKRETGKRIVFNPEYIGEGNYPVPYWQGWPHPTEMSLHQFQILGGTRDDCQAVAEVLKRALGPACALHYTDSTTAELTKYMENTFFAAKVTFCQQMYDLAEKLDVNYDELRELWLLDGRVGASHTAVFRDNRGFGGKCLPKDLAALIAFGQKLGCDVSFLEAVQDYNCKVRGE